MNWDPKKPPERIKMRLDEDVRAALNSGRVCIILAQHQEEVIGLSRGDILCTDPIFRLRDDNRCGYVDQMFVKPSYRGQRIGARLLQRCEDWFRAQGVKHSVLHAAPRAVRFYAARGYLPNREMFKRL